jgi:arylsulfatase A-like enzyme
LYPSEHGVWNNVDVGNTLSRGLFDGVRLFSEDLREAGYALSFSGKWHVSAVETPADRGWQQGWPPPRTAPSAHLRRPDTHEWARYAQLGPEPSERGEGEIVRPGYGTYTHYGTAPDIWDHDRRTLDDALRVIRERPAGAGPWCQYIGTIGPHDPYTVPREFVDLYALDDIELPSSHTDLLLDKPRLYRRTRDRFDQLGEREQRQALRHYLAHCSVQDQLFGQVLGALEERGELENTLVVYLSDHGDYAGEHGLWCKGLPCFRGAYHIPALVRWPTGVRRPGRCVDAFVSLADFAPTFLEAAGVPVDRAFSGASLLPWLRDEEPDEWRDALFTQSNGNELYGIQRSVMTREWKYVYNGFDDDELYWLTEDPHETVNLAGDRRYDAVVRELSARLWQFAREHDDVCINPYIMVSLAPYGPGVAGEGGGVGDAGLRSNL